MAKESFLGQTAEVIKESINTIKNTAMEFLTGLTAESMTDNGSRENSMEKVFSRLMESSTTEYGRTGTKRDS